ncbi:MAG: RluA family pseudouridine synthase [Clostridia bacterium]
MNMRHDVTQTENGWMLLKVLRDTLRLSNTLVKRLKRSRGVFLNGQTGFVRTRVQTGDVVEVMLEEHVDNNHLFPRDLSLRILFEDDHLIALDKPPGLLVHPSGPRREDTCLNGLKHHFLLSGARVVPRPVGRLDRQTSGVVVFAKNAHVHALMIQTMKRPESVKKYLGLVRGVPREDGGTMDFPIGRAGDSIILRMVAEDGKPSRTRYRVLERYKDASLLEFNLESGRTHQIRLHCQAMGFPLLGDGLYGEEKPSPIIHRPALHACESSFIHPLTGERVTICAPLPPDMALALERLGLGT